MREDDPMSVRGRTLQYACGTGGSGHEQNMGNAHVFQLAQEADVDTNTILRILQEMGSAVSALEQRVDEVIADNVRRALEAQVATPSSITRGRKSHATPPVRQQIPQGREAACQLNTGC